MADSALCGFGFNVFFLNIILYFKIPTAYKWKFQFSENFWAERLHYLMHSNIDCCLVDALFM